MNRMPFKCWLESKHDELNTGIDEEIAITVHASKVIKFSLALSRVRGGIIHDSVDKNGASIDAAGSSQVGRQRVGMNDLV